MKSEFYGKIILTTLFVLIVSAIQVSAATFTVTNTNDSGVGSLRQAILDANTAAGADTIVFSTLFNTPQTITLTTAVNDGFSIADSASGSVTITGPGANLLTVNINNTSRLFTIPATPIVSISGMRMTGGNGNFGGGGGAILTSGNLTLNDVVITGNTITNGQYGGGIWLLAGSLTMTSSTVSNNTAAGYGGGIYANNGTTFNLSNSVISGNIAQQTNLDFGSGGGMYIDNANFTMTDTTVSGNRSSASGGGGIALGGGSGNTVTISRSTISSNTAAASSGGGLAFNNSALGTMTNSTISGNSAPNGGGIGTRNIVITSLFTFSHTTVAGNTATGTGGGVNTNFALNFNNSIIGDNNAATSPDYNGTLNSGGYNLLENNSGATITGTTTGNITGQDPFLDIVLRSNGGATRTHALRRNSPAIDAGSPTSPPATDQRGSARPVAINGTARADIGAYERQTVERTISEPFDFDGDGKADVSVFRPSTNAWYLQRSLSGAAATTFGATNDLIAPVDFDGDGRADISIFRPSTGTWFRINSSNGQLNGIQFGQSGDLPRPGDFDGDERADICVFRPSTGAWYYIQSSNNQSRGIQFGQNGDVPMIVDFDADGKSDLAVFRPSNGYWYWIKSSDGQFQFAQFGLSGDVPLSGDFTGDGRSDLAVFRPSDGFWYVARPIGVPAQNFEATPFGISSDVPVPADYDDDGKTDLAVFRSGVWYIKQSSSSGVSVTNFGVGSDKAIPSAFGN